MNISGIDIYHLVKELQLLVGSKVQKAYGNDSYPLILDLYGFKYRYLFVDLPFILRFSDEKGIMPKKPPGFVERSRKHLQGLRIKSISQHGMDRVIVVELEGRFYRKLIIELFAKGNIIICDENDRMLTVLRQEAFASRVIKSGKQYLFPPKTSNVSLDNLESFKQSLEEYADNHLLTIIAQSGFGGKYAEKALKSVFTSKFNNKIALKNTSEKELKSLYQVLSDYKNADSFRMEEGDIMILPHNNDANSMIDLLYLNEKKTIEAPITKESEDKKDRIVRIQKERAEKLSVEAESMQKAGSLIFERYEDIRKALEFAKEFKKKNGSLKGLLDVWPDNLPKLIKISDDSRIIEIDL